MRLEASALPRAAACSRRVSSSSSSVSSLSPHLSPLYSSSLPRALRASSEARCCAFRAPQLPRRRILSPGHCQRGSESAAWSGSSRRAAAAATSAELRSCGAAELGARRRPPCPNPAALTVSLTRLKQQECCDRQVHHRCLPRRPRVQRRRCCGRHWQCGTLAVQLQVQAGQKLHRINTWRGSHGPTRQPHFREHGMEGTR